MIETQYTFSVLQYRHDTWTGEALNVGVLLSAPDVKFLDMKVLEESARLEQAYPDMDVVGFQRLLDSIYVKVTSVARDIRRGRTFSEDTTSSSIARKLVAEEDSALGWLEAGAGVASSPEVELDRLFSRYVSPKDSRGGQSSSFDNDLFLLRQQKLSSDYRHILRAVFYRQSLSRMMNSRNGSTLEQRLKALELAGLLRNSPEGSRLTVSGMRALKKAYGMKRPPMIDFKQDARLPKKEQKKEFIVGRSLASLLAREARNGE